MHDDLTNPYLMRGQVTSHMEGAASGVNTTQRALDSTKEWLTRIAAEHEKEGRHAEAAYTYEVEEEVNAIHTLSVALAKAIEQFNRRYRTTVRVTDQEAEAVCAEGELPDTLAARIEHIRGQ